MKQGLLANLGRALAVCLLVTLGAAAQEAPLSPQRQLALLAMLNNPEAFLRHL